MKLSPRPPMPLDLRRVMKALRRVGDRQDSTLDIATARQELTGLIARMAPGHLDAEILSTIDGYVDSYVADFLREMYERHVAVLNELDLLEIRVRPHLDRSGELDDHEQQRLSHMDGAVTHALDRLSDPDTPYLDPIPRPEPVPRQTRRQYR